MNVHVVTPTQAALAQARKEREARIKEAAAKAVQTPKQASRFILVSDAAKRAAERARLIAEEEERSRKWREIKAAKEKDRWRASWRYMVQLADEKQRRATVYSGKQILEQTAAKYGMTVDDLKSAKRTRAYCQPRFEFYWRARRETSLSLPQIGRISGGRDHTTVLHGVRKYEALRRFMRTGEYPYKLTAFNLVVLYPALIITDGAE
jgi:chromosomal replication initiation ATPase DnaA